MVKNMSAVVDNILECITVEIEMSKSKNILISCVYRTPGTPIDIFKDRLTNLMVIKNKLFVGILILIF